MKEVKEGGKGRALALLPVALDLFDGGGGAAAGGAGTAGNGGQAAGQAGGQSLEPGKKVVYGKQAVEDRPSGRSAQPNDASRAETGEKNPQRQSSSDTLEERQRRYRELVGGEFKDLYDEDTKRLVSRSAREAAALREQADRAQPILDMLLDRYKIGDGDMNKLLAAVESDSAYWSQAAEEAGMSVEQFKRFQQLQRQNAELLRQQRERMGRDRADAQIRAWNDQAEQLKAVYPSFDLTREAQNRDFLSMLKAGVPVRQAYEVVHMDEIKAATAAMQAKATEKAVTDNIKAKGTRPQENGTGAASGFTMKDDVHKLTPKDRAEIAKRVSRGEVITF